jgi:hypothetical protein
MVSVFYIPTSTDCMNTGFLNTTEGGFGTLTQKEILRTFRHTIECTQSQFSDYNTFNWLFLVAQYQVTSNMWVYYANDPDHEYQDLVKHPGDSPDC